MSYFDLKKLVELSINYERDTSVFYREILPYVKNKRVKVLVEKLIEEETKHIKKLREFASNMDSVGFIQFPPEIQFTKPLSGRGYSEMSYSEIINLALELEKHTHKFYKDAASEAPRGPVEEFFKAMSNFEQSHINLLEREITYSS